MQGMCTCCIMLPCTSPPVQQPVRWMHWPCCSRQPQQLVHYCLQCLAGVVTIPAFAQCGGKISPGGCKGPTCPGGCNRSTCKVTRQ